MIKIGTDPELFLRDELGFISAYGLFPGTKNNPFPVEKGAVQVDGMALEFNIDPAETEDEFENNIKTVLIQLEEMVNEVGAGQLRTVFEPYAEFDQEYFILRGLDEKMLGCDPDFTHLGREKIPPDGLQDSPFRTAAGHMHIGWTSGIVNVREDKHFEECKNVARAFIDQPLFYPRTANEKKRVKYYGAPGSFRPTSYGCELRSPSNIWVKEEKTRRKMYNTVRKRMADLGKS